MKFGELINRKVPPAAIWTIATILAVCVGDWLQSGVHLNHDVSWIAHSARWLLQGRTFGIDVLDPTPPMAWLLSLPAASLADSGLLDEAVAVRYVYWTYFLISTALLFHLLSQVNDSNKAAAIGWRIAFLASATLAPGASFGQREYVSVMFAMPYLAAAVLRLQADGRPMGAVTGMASVTVGVLAGIGFAIKPYFLAVPLLIECLVAARLGLRATFRTETVTLASVIAAYVLGIFVLMPQYLEHVLPLVRATYWAYDAADFSMVLDRYWSVVQPAAYGALIALAARRWTSLHIVLLLALAGYSASYLIQAKGFVYHAYPVLLCAVVFLGVALSSAVSQVWSRFSQSRAAVRFASVAALVILALVPIKQRHDDVARWYAQFNIAWGSTGTLRQAVIATVNRYAPSRGSFFYAFSTHPFPGFPTASYTTADWSGRSATQFMLPAYARVDEIRDGELRKQILAAGVLQRKIVTEDLLRRPPAVVFWYHSRGRLGMNGREFDDLAFYLQDSQFRQLWSRYGELRPIGPLRVFVRQHGAKHEG